MKTTVNLLFTLLLTIAVAGTLEAQVASIKGKVVDSQNGEELIGANVNLIGTSLGAATDLTGRYLISNIQPGRYVLRVAFIGYESIEDTLDISASMNLDLDYTMSYTKIQGEEVTITAQARGQMNAINRQLAEKSLVNVVSSDRIQELPDANAAESVARIPGITVQREGGEGNKVVIRGLSPKYNSVSVNGIRLAATDSSDRSTDLSMVSQFMLDGIEVTKAGTPDQDADVLGGRVNFKLKKADPGLHANFLVQGMHNGLRSSYDDYKLVANVSNRFFNNKLGILGLLDFENRDRSSYELAASYDNPNAVIDSLNALRSRFISLNDITRNNDRRNSLFVTDFTLPDGYVSYSFLNSSIISDQTEYFEAYDLSGNNRRWSSGWADGKTGVKTHILEYDQTFASKFQIEATASWSKSLQDRDVFASRFLKQFAYTQNVLGVNVNSVQDFLEDDIDSAVAEGYSINRDDNDETDRSLSLDLSYRFRLNDRLSGRLKFGGKYRNKQRNFDKNVESGRINFGWQPALDALFEEFPRFGSYAGPGARQIPYSAFYDEEYDGSNFFGGDFTLGPFADLDFLNEVSNFLAENWSAAGYWEEISHTFQQTNSNLYDYSGSENYSASYFMTDLDIGSKLNVVMGARFERNQTEYSSWQGYQTVIPSYTFAGYDKVISKRKNDFLLPAIFLRYRPKAWLETRAAYTHTLARPSYADILPLANYLGASRSVQSRNPDLVPALSKNIDLSVSFSGNRLGFFSVGYFEKNIRDLIFSSGRRYIADPAEFGLPAELEKGFILDYISNNPEDVKLRGVELDFQTRFWYLPGFLNGFVFNANYTRTTSDVKYPRTIIDFEIDFGPPLVVTPVNNDTLYVDRLIDQPDQIMNLSLGYDYRAFSARLSMIYRSDIFRRTNFWPELRESTAGFRRWDLSIKQGLPFEGWDMYLNVSNITESEDINRLLDRSRALGQRQFYGRTIDLGVRFSF